MTDLDALSLALTTPDEAVLRAYAELQDSYEERRRAYLEQAAEIEPHITAWPQRRSRKRRPEPGVFDLAEEDNG